MWIAGVVFGTGKSVFYGFSDCVTGDSRTKRLIRDISRWNMVLERKRSVLNQRMNALIFTQQETTAAIARCDGDVISELHHARSIKQLRREYNSIKRTCDRLDTIQVTIKDKFREHMTATDIKAACEIMKEINSFVRDESVVESFETLEMEMEEGKKTTVQMDKAIGGLGKEEKKQNDQEKENDDFELMEIIHEAKNKTTTTFNELTLGAIEVHNHDKALEERLEKLKA